MEKTAVLQLHKVSKTIRRRRILNEISLTVSSGEIVGLLGPNGSGKTTLIRSVLGLVSSTGAIQISGYSIRDRFEEAISQAGAIVENPEFYHYLSGYQNLVHFANMSDPVEGERISEVVQLTGLIDRIHDPVRTYSLGMRQRLGIAQAILHRPKLLLLDEPTNGLDPAGIRELRDYLKRLRDEENTAILISTHLLKEVEDLCDRAAIINNGEILSVQEVRGKRDSLPIPVFFEVDKPDEAVKLLEGTQTEAKPDGIQLLIPHSEIPAVNRRLAEAGIGVYAIQPKPKNLEDSFLELTKEPNR
ncbi:ATP-binding cassette domain-containing protein [Bacillus mangrovi]|uniref:ATP-binding cassette domain-containing protein n=1 Tax=Metabacillus mangrovi TaxID=1491830 RepID=A0A7X2S8G5_9BACI|nr:ABC transporter ATP-binding protein [Metabacillus mangrovi]MTH54711.1 ATP-binding cassette domain-containing protein [Metabacillus mangrovi]